jgi:ribosomal protein S18 acetylase RimI-like enzyme
MNIEIQQAIPEDAQNILSLQYLAYQSEAMLYNDWTIPPLTQTLEDLRAEFKSSHVLKATSEKTLIGSVRAKADGETCSIGRLIVHPDYQRRGIGSRLMTQIEELYPSVHRFELFTGSLSDGNIRLYRTLGYCPFRMANLSSSVTLVYMEKKVCVR